VLSHQPLAVALAILHIEWMIQAHYTESVRDNQNLDPQFKSLLKHHWMEEAQHARLDTLMVEALAEGLSPREIAETVDEYFQIGEMLDQGLAKQVKYGADSFTKATERNLSEWEHKQFMAVQHQANRWTYLGSGMTHPNFLATIDQLASEQRERIEEVAPAFC
tara:strand:- start:1648 stop:2136 length:489 start_codon:yes stop_codon:yes gene_type:complete